jgi:hypothetical protein
MVGRVVPDEPSKQFGHTTLFCAGVRTRRPTLDFIGDALHPLRQPKRRTIGCELYRFDFILVERRPNLQSGP